MRGGGGRQVVPGRATPNPQGSEGRDVFRVGCAAVLPCAQASRRRPRPCAQPAAVGRLCAAEVRRALCPRLTSRGGGRQAAATVRLQGGAESELLWRGRPGGSGGGSAAESRPPREVGLGGHPRCPGGPPHCGGALCVPAPHAGPRPRLRGRGCPARAAGKATRGGVCGQSRRRLCRPESLRVAFFDPASGDSSCWVRARRVSRARQRGFRARGVHV
mmetsp:Transcript_10588/g.21018  ORF Transcript_10588/g.21018 Transcript_10588/m.21018 type:complete len:217 (+) Transcript_10588:278-928(+)